MKKIIIIIGVIIFILCGCLCGYFIYSNTNNLTIDLEKQMIGNESIKIYTTNDYEEFLSDYQNNKLPDVYITKFLYDGAGIYKTYDLDDFIEKGNDLEVDVLETNVLNIKNIGSYELSGKYTGMIAVNSNNLVGKINIILNNVTLDTDSKKIPAIYVYNKDITYDKCIVTISAKEGSKNTIEGGKLKKISLLDKDNLSTYEKNYSGDNLNNYNNYSNYYGVYSKEELDKILFATVTADKEDLADGDPYLYYKGSGAISSDIDLYFEGKGYLEVISKNKEGIESKGNLTFSGGVGDYLIKSQDDCLNTTTSDSENSNAHNDLIINVKSLTAIVDNEADEGDAIDSNGKLVIDGGTIIALPKYGADSGLDAEKGVFINKGEVLAIASGMDAISSESKQRFIVLNTSMDEGSLITMLDSNNKVVFAFESDRKYSSLVYSSNKLKEATYHLYKDGTITGNNSNGFYTDASFSNGVQLGYTSLGTNNFERGGTMKEMPDGERPEGNPPEMPNGERPEGNPPEMPNGEKPEGNPPELPNGERPEGNPPKMPNGERPEGNPPEMPNGEQPNGNPNGMDPNNINPVNQDFVLSGISNIFTGIGELIKE